MASTGVGPREMTAFRRGKLSDKPLTAQEREQLMKPYLPEPILPSSPPKSRQSPREKRKPGCFRHGLHVIIYATMSFLFSIFFRFRRSWRLVKSKVVALLKYHHRTPEFIQRDVRHLKQLPKHLSVVLQFYEGDEDQGSAGLEGLVNDVGEIAAWTAAAGIPFLSVYERTGAYIHLTLDFEFEFYSYPILHFQAFKLT